MSEPTKLGELISRLVLTCDAHGCTRDPAITLAFIGHEFEPCEPCAQHTIDLHNDAARAWRWVSR